MPAMNVVSMHGARVVRLHPGVGILAGFAPEEVDGPDGRAKKLNVPSIVQVIVFDRSSWQIVAAPRSGPDGTWQVEGLDPSRNYVVLGVDMHGTVNAAVQDWIKPHVPEP